MPRVGRAPVIVDTLLLKLILTPALIATASLAGRRFGPAVGGWLVGFPLTSAPVALFLTLSHGPAFATTAAAGTMAGAVSQAAFCVAYGWLAPRHRWPLALAGSSLAFGVSTAALALVTLSPLPLFAIVITALAAAMYLMPGGGRAPRAARPSQTGAVAPLGWDLPARMVVATVFVVLLTGIAPALGPRLTGLLAPFPLYGAVLAVFAQALEGPGPATALLRGMLSGLFGFAGFFVVLATCLEAVGLAAAFAAAIALTLTAQGIAFWTLRRGPARGTAV
jgi:hypothetical protein